MAGPEDAPSQPPIDDSPGGLPPYPVTPEVLALLEMLTGKASDRANIENPGCVDLPRPTLRPTELPPDYPFGD